MSTFFQGFSVAVQKVRGVILSQQMPVFWVDAGRGIFQPVCNT